MDGPTPPVGATSVQNRGLQLSLETGDEMGRRIKLDPMKMSKEVQRIEKNGRNKFISDPACRLQVVTVA